MRRVPMHVVFVLGAVFGGCVVALSTTPSARADATDTTEARQVRALESMAASLKKGCK